MGYNDYMSGATTIILEQASAVEEKRIQSTIACFVLLENSEQFAIDEKSYNLEILGQPMYTWVTRACPTFPVTIEVQRDMSPLEVIRPYLKETDYTVVLYGDTPLIKKSSIEQIVDYVEKMGINVCKLTRGWVYKTDYIKRVSEVFAPQTYYFNEEDFICADNFKQLDLVVNILKNRIIDYHMSNGVFFTNPKNVEIDANVVIGKNTIIKGATRLLGKTQVGESCEIDNSTIISSRLYERVKVRDCKVKKSVISSDCVVDTLSIIENGTFIGRNSSIGKNCNIGKTRIGENVAIRDNNFIASARIQDLAWIANKVTIAGNDKDCVRILSNAKIEDGANIGPGVTIFEGDKVSLFQTVKKDYKARY